VQYFKPGELCFLADKTKLGSSYLGFDSAFLAHQGIWLYKEF